MSLHYFGGTACRPLTTDSRHLSERIDVQLSLVNHYSSQLQDDIASLISSTEAFEKVEYWSCFEPRNDPRRVIASTEAKIGYDNRAAALLVEGQAWSKEISSYFLFSLDQLLKFHALFISLWWFDDEPEDLWRTQNVISFACFMLMSLHHFGRTACRPLTTDSRHLSERSEIFRRLIST